MLYAIEPATDQPVHADDASSWRAYRCPRCNTPVLLRAGAIRAAHFAHASGLADPDCEEYFGGFAGGSLRRSRGYADRFSSEDSADASALYFDLHADGPKLGLWVPSSIGGPVWSGAIEVLAANTNRRLTYPSLERGTLVEFPLFDGQWFVHAIGEVAPTYLSRLLCGPSSLDNAINVFEAGHVPGRLIGPSAPIRLGQAVWVITRDTECQQRRPESASLELIGVFGGWIVHLVKLPGTAAVQQLREIQSWLRRQVRPALAKIWIERPFPFATTPSGELRFALEDGPIEIRADQAVDLSITDGYGKEFAQLGKGTRRAVWESVAVGAWRISANGRPFLPFAIDTLPATIQSALEIRVDDSKFDTLFEAQRHLNARVASGARQVKVLIRWSTERIAEILRIDGTQEVAVGTELSINIRPGIAISFDRLGKLEWKVVPSASADRKLPSQLRGTARWLLSTSEPVAAGPMSIGPIRADLMTDPLFGSLARRSWSTCFAAHVAYLRKHIGISR